MGFVASRTAGIMKSVARNIDAKCNRSLLRFELTYIGASKSRWRRILFDEMKSVIAGPCNRKRHLGVDFVIWSRESAWFWFLIHPRGKGGMIGATTNEARAMREVRSSIEAILAVSRRGSPQQRLAQQPSEGS
jgi:hypothetical protein